MTEPATTAQSPAAAGGALEPDPEAGDAPVPLGTPPAPPSPAEDQDGTPFTGPESGKKRRRPGRPAVHQGCQVCGASLEGMRVFHQRYHICELHMQAEMVMWKGAPHRFCQQCGRFHDLSEFEQGMRSCKKQLARHAERRRRGRERAAAERAAARAARAAGGAAPLPAMAGSSRDTEGTASLPTAAAAVAAKIVSQQPADVDGAASVAQATAETTHERTQQQLAERAQEDQQQAAEALQQQPGGGGRSGSGVSTAAHLSAASQSAGGISALLSAAAAEEAAEAAAAVEAAGAEGSGQRARKQPRLPLEPDLTWFAPQPAAAPAALDGSPLNSGHLGLGAISALNSSTLDGISGAAVPAAAGAVATAAAAAQAAAGGGAAAASLPGGLPQAHLASMLAALQVGAPGLAPAVGLQQLLLPQHAAILSSLQLAAEQQQQQQRQQSAPQPDAHTQRHQQELLQSLRALAAPRSGVPTPPLPLQAVPAVHPSAPLEQQQREQHVALLFQAAVGSLLGGVLGRPPGPP